MKYVNIENLLTNENIHALPEGNGIASGKLVVFVEDIERLAEVANVSEQIFDDIERLLKECSLYAHGDDIGAPSMVQTALFVRKLKEMRNNYH